MRQPFGRTESWRRSPTIRTRPNTSDRTDGSAGAWRLAVASARARISPGIADFLERLRRRRERDVRPLREYYEEIDLEIRRKLARPRLDDDLRRRERDRLDATHRAVHTRGAEVADRYRVRLRLAPIGVWVCRLPAYYIKVTLMRRNAAAAAVFSWNPIDGRVEPRTCDGCLAPTDSAWLCDHAVHYVCGACLAAFVSAADASAVRARARVRHVMRRIVAQPCRPGRLRTPIAVFHRLRVCSKFCSDRVDKRQVGTRRDRIGSNVLGQNPWIEARFEKRESS